MDFWTIFAGICLFLAGIGATLLFLWLVDKKAYSLQQQVKSEKGHLIKQEQSERLMAFMLEVKEAYTRAKADNKDIRAFAAQDLPEIALRYPDVMIKFGSRLKKLLEDQGLLDLEGLIAG